jgi:hypothetical protein
MNEAQLAGATGLIDNIFKALFAKELMSIMISAFGVAAVIYAFLDLFMTAGLRIKYRGKLMTENEKSAFVISIMLILLTFLPIALAVVPIFMGAKNQSFFQTSGETLAGFVIGLLLCLIMSMILKSKLNFKPKGILLIGEALGVISQTLSKFLADWLMRAALKIVDTAIKVVHRPFILEYWVVATILHVSFGFALTIMMGASNAAGMANLLGSFLGQLIHFAVRYKQLKKLKEQYIQEAAEESDVKEDKDNASN